MTCEREKTTHHHGGAGKGFGPVQPGETVLLAVFASTECDVGTGRVAPEAFKSKQLKRDEVSVARRLYTSRTDFEDNVVEPAKDRAGSLRGVSSALADTIRELRFECADAQPPVAGRAFCLLDIVGPRDHDGHAAIGYSEAQNPLTDTQKKTVRAQIHADLADVFFSPQLLDIVPFET